MSIKKVVGKIHLWLGLLSGIVIVFLGVTGCLLAFETEIRNATESFRKVEKQETPYLLPAAIKSIAEPYMASKKVLGVDYPGRDKAAIAMYYDENNYELLFLNPYSGEVVKHKDMTHDFFRVVLAGHYNLWLPGQTGRVIVSSATLIFFVMIVSGIILWWPKNKGARKQRFSIKWNARWRRRNYDLHHVLGFYMCWIAIFIVITGLVMGFQWFAHSVYWVSSGGEKMVEHKHPVSDTTLNHDSMDMADKLWTQHLGKAAANESVGVYFANANTDPIEVVVNHKPGTYYRSDYFHYDQFSGKELEAAGSYSGKFSDAKLADKIVRMNYDIHVGAIMGLPGKLLAFFASLIAASLPVTGFIIWRGRNQKQKKLMRSMKKSMPPSK